MDEIVANHLKCERQGWTLNDKGCVIDRLQTKFLFACYIFVFNE